MDISYISLLIETKILDEAIQELIKDMKSTQHGDRTNPLYALMKDWHVEGGVWKHTLIALQSLPELVTKLDQEFEGGEFSRLYKEYLPHIRAAVLYHDVGKLVTQEPSKKRVGSFSFPGHAGGGNFIAQVLDKYGLKTNTLVAQLAGEHHITPADVPALKAEGWDNEQLMLLAIIKAADSMAVGPKDAKTAIDHIIPFLQAAGFNKKGADSNATEK